MSLCLPLLAALGCPGEDVASDGGTYIEIAQHAPWQLVATTYRGGQQELWLQDSDSGNSRLMGTLGDIGSWSPALTTISRDGNRLYFGEEPDEHSKRVQVFDIRSGIHTDTLSFERELSQLGGVDAEGHVLAIYGDWNTGACDLSLLDPASGSRVVVLQIGERCRTFNNQRPVLSRDARTLYYHAGTGAGDDIDKLFVIDLSGRVITSSPRLVLGQSPVIAGEDSRRRLIALAWNGSAEQVYAVDTKDGSVSTLGTLDGLLVWPSLAYVSPDGQVLYAVGSSDAAGSNNRVYAFDLLSDEFMGDIPAAEYLLLGVIGDQIHRFP